MDIASQMESWRDLFVLLGTSAAALIGLLFIVMTLHVDAIEETPGHDLLPTVHGARNNTFHLLTVFVVCAIALAPQPPTAFGLELIALNLYGLRLPIGFTLRWSGRKIRVDSRGGFPLPTIITIAAAYLLGIAGGFAVLMRMDWSLLAVAGSCGLLIVRTVLTAWGLLFGARQATENSYSTSTAEGSPMPSRGAGRSPAEPMAEPLAGAVANTQSSFD